MEEILIALILLSAIIMVGLRRIKLLTRWFAIQSLLIAGVCLLKGIELKEYHYYILFGLTLVTKVFIAPLIINRAVRHLKINRELEFVINIFWSYILTGAFIVITFAALKTDISSFMKAGVVLMGAGMVLLIGRKKAITQMLGLLTLENGIVLLEIAMIKMGAVIEFGIIFELLILVLIMGIMIFRINQTFDTVNTDYLSELKE